MLMDGNDENLFKNEGYELMGAAFEVYNELGSGYAEEVYQEAMELELSARRIPFVSKPRLPIHFKGQALRSHHEADLLVHSTLLVELKAKRVLAPEDDAQLLSTLKAARLRVGYLLNFGAVPKLQWHRRVDYALPDQ
jgi:GxxExxY protein